MRDGSENDLATVLSGNCFHSLTAEKIDRIKEGTHSIGVFYPFEF
jgi:hypothetical protein